MVWSRTILDGIVMFFTPPYETFASLQARLKNIYAQANVDTVEAMASFVCRKES